MESKKASPKRKLSLILSVLLVAALSVGITLAYLTDTTEQRVNNFTFASNDALDARLVEPNWDGVVDYEYDNDGDLWPVYGYTSGGDPIYGYDQGDPDEPVTNKGLINGDTTRPRDPDGNNPANGEPYGDEASKLMIPGAVALKNPVVYNTGTLLDEWVAVKVTFVYNAGHPSEGQPLSLLDYNKVMDVVDIDWQTEPLDNWELIAGGTDVSKVFYYKELLEKDDFINPGVYDATDPLFTRVAVDTSKGPSDIAALEEIGGFVIYIEGFAAQSSVAAESGTDEHDYDGFKDWGLAGNVVFNHTPTTTSPANVSPPGILKKS
ncbi:MAG: hypothetical protein LBQ33_00940 [Oscillospiraceae bacterium]|jgi:predicted ribosomally synthesized peptide with SipW-like signal peptide|nr:hypothetical protein [Oscillospiraceae bacterium]